MHLLTYFCYVRMFVFDLDCKFHRLINNFLLYADVELLNAVSSGSSDVVRFLTVMATCNTVIPTRRYFAFILAGTQIWIMQD